VRVRIVRLAVAVAALVNREGVRQVLLVGQVVRKLAREGDLILGVEIPRECEIRADIQAPVGALVEVGRIPESLRVVMRPRRQVIRLGVDQVVMIPVIVRPLAGDAVGV
jgi:hypothetical protein